MTTQTETFVAATKRGGPPLRHSPYPPIVSKALLQFAKLHVLRWERALRHVEEEQEKALRSLVRHAARSEFGKKHGFGEIRCYRDYAARVPLGDYDSFSPYIERMRDGEENVLVPERVVFYGNSSGSSTFGKSKFLPIAERQIRHQQKSGTDAVMRYLVATGDDGFLRGFTLGLFPPITPKKERASLVTSNPALMATRMPVFTRPVYLPDEETKKIADYDHKIRVIAEKYLDWDVRAVAGTTCWFSVLFEKVLDVARGRGRSARCVRDIWPNLKVLLGGGVSAEPYLPIIRELVGGKVTLMDTYNATEGGIYAASDHSGERGMPMLPHRGTFFELVAMDDPNRRRVPLWAVEKDRPYSIVVSTVSGLYAYELGDIVRFTQTDPPRIEFMGRLQGCLSVTQELTTHVEVERAVAHALAKVPCRTVDFGAAPDVGIKSRYALYVEFDEEPNSLSDFASAFDEGMQKENRVYREHRKDDVAILPPRVIALEKGGAKKFLDEITRGNVQGKFPRILDEMKKAKLQKYAKKE